MVRMRQMTKNKNPGIAAGILHFLSVAPIHFGTLKIAIRFPPMLIVSIREPTKTFLLFLFTNLHGPFVIRSPRVAAWPW